MRRRGVEHGFLTPASDVAVTLPDADLAAAWQRGEPIALPEHLTASLPVARPWIEESLALFGYCRDGGRFLDAILAILEEHAEFRPEGSSVDLLEPREIEKVFVSGLTDGKRARGGRDIWAKLAWIAHDDGDESLRVRFSCGAEQLHDWHGNVDGQRWSDRLAEAVFPEGLLLARDETLLEMLGSLLEAPARLSERIVYSNAPGGGAVFHHDADPTQRGVVYAQMAGATAWLALPEADLARQIAAHASSGRQADLPVTEAAAREALSRDDHTALYELLNADPSFTARLADAGWLSVLEPGDVLLLPSPTPGVCAWHSVFALGDAPSLAHSYGVFAG